MLNIYTNCKNITNWYQGYQEKTRAETAQTMANSEVHEKSSESHETFMRKSEESHEKVMRKSRESQEKVMKSHEKVIRKSRESHEKLMGKS